ncbi:streptophobe family protein [Streptomyces spiramyceticus]|uniref:streptophobe family protein n=1 Tax=Streptomyces spiramyceticus TaxID=299717 RepID=UPI00237BA33D|nr:streptophobe family protein [Streptomyces spiramyceticus]
MGAGGSVGVRWGDVLFAAIASVSWALVGMAGVAALGLHLLGADSAASLGPMTAAVVVLGAGGSVSPSGNVSAFGLEGAEATTAVDIAPLGVGLVGALLLAFFFLRSLRGAGKVISGGELAARAGSVAVLFVATMGGLAWAGHDVITIDGDALGGALGLDDTGDVPGGIADRLPDGLGDIGGLLPGGLPDRLADLADAKASVGFTVNTGDSLVGGACWVVGVLVIALLASRRTPLPRGWDAMHRVVRPAASALVTVLVVAVVAGLAAAAYAAVGDDHPKRVVGAALLGTPNGVWLGIPLGLLVPWDGEATGELAKVLPDPLDELLRAGAEEPVTLGRLAELDGRIWLLGVAAAVMMLYAGVLAAARTPRGELSVAGFAGRCGVRLGVVAAIALPLLVWLTDVSADASLSVLGFDAFGAGIELHGSVPMAVLMGLAWGAGAGSVGALLACAAGVAGARAAALASASALGGGGGRTYPDLAYVPGPYRPSPAYRPSHDDTNPYLRPPEDVHGAPTVAGPMVPPPPVGPRRPPPPVGPRRPWPPEEEGPPPGWPGRRG